MSKTKITINRALWRTGDTGIHRTGTGSTELLNAEGYMCCLGFICSQVSDQDILGKSNPNDLKEPVLGLSNLSRDGCDCPTCQEANKMYVVDTELTSKAITINDSKNTTPEEKELALLELFKDSCYELEFIGEFTKTGPRK